MDGIDTKECPNCGGTRFYTTYRVLDLGAGVGAVVDGDSGLHPQQGNITCVVCGIYYDPFKRAWEFD